MTNSINGGTADDQSTNDRSDKWQSGKSSHDIRASLAITHGFNQALESSFSDLVLAYQFVLGSQGGDMDATDLDKLQSLEEDCRFCITRISRSLAQLGERIDAVTIISSQAGDGVGETHT